MRTLAGRRSILQVHPTRRCNLRCAHCYSSSGPELRTELGVEQLTRAVHDAAALGYGQLSVSGGEPFLYGELPQLLRSAREAGMGTTAVTNGTVLTARRLEAVAPHLDVLAVSVDGTPAAHDLVRGSSTAFSRMRRGLAAVRELGIPFGLIGTLTLFNVDQLDWLARFAVDEGAAVLQVHPLDGERPGRRRPAGRRARRAGAGRGRRGDPSAAARAPRPGDPPRRGDARAAAARPSPVRPARGRRPSRARAAARRHRRGGCRAPDLRHRRRAPLGLVARGRAGRAGPPLAARGRPPAGGGTRRGARGDGRARRAGDAVLVRRARGVQHAAA